MLASLKFWHEVLAMSAGVVTVKKAGEAVAMAASKAGGKVISSIVEDCMRCSSDLSFLWQHANLLDAEHRAEIES